MSFMVMFCSGPTVGPNGPQRRYRGQYVSSAFTWTGKLGSPGIIAFLGRDANTGEWQNPVDTKEVRVCGVRSSVLLHVP